MLYEMIAVVRDPEVFLISRYSTLTIYQVRVGRPHNTNEVKECAYSSPLKLLQSQTRNTNTASSRIARTAGNLILAQGGVVRGITNWGPFLLTKPTKKNQMRHDSGHHFIMRFDASPEVQKLVRKTIAIDPRMIRCGVVKMGERLKDIVDVKGTVDWQRRRADLGSGYF